MLRHYKLRTGYFSYGQNVDDKLKEAGISEKEGLDRHFKKEFNNSTLFYVASLWIYKHYCVANDPKLIKSMFNYGESLYRLAKMTEGEDKLSCFLHAKFFIDQCIILQNNVYGNNETKKQFATDLIKEDIEKKIKELNNPNQGRAF